MTDRIHIGTSGWHYPHWENGVFYPPGLAQTDQLVFYARSFATVELNASFYHLPRAATFEGWREKTPDGFVFAVKASRYITHVKRLRDCREAWEKLILAAGQLREKLGPILFQLPPSFEGNVGRLRDFLGVLPPDHLYAFEFRHPSWLCREVYQALRDRHVALCIPDDPGLSKAVEVTADFVYVRMHSGSSGPKYSDQELTRWADIVRGFLARDLDVYVYFNNDAFGYALQNARELLRLLAG